MTKRTSSRWPDGPSTAGQNQLPDVTNPPLPGWAGMPAPAMRQLPRPPPWAAAYFILSAACLALGIYCGRPDGPVIILLAVLAAGLGALATWRERLAAARIDGLKRQLDTVFGRAGISLWLEDWTPVSEALMLLLNAGVRDMQAYFTMHPAAARELRHKVIIKDVNDFTVEMMGAPNKSVFIGSLDRILPDTDQTFIEWLIAFARGDRFYRSETHITRPDGSHIDCLFTAALPTDTEGFKNILVSCLDITAYKHNQEKLVQAETEIARVSRITTIGALTASIAHEINSPLAAIVSNAEAALRWFKRPVPDLGEAEAAITRVVMDSIRVREVVARTRSFLSNSPRQMDLVDLTDVVRQSIVLIDRELRALNVSLHFDADDQLPPILADPVHIQQVMVNLMINGAQAMAGVSGPRDLTVTIRRENKNLRVAVRDIGHGIDAASHAKIFEPFFSTKPNGVGMGLAICKNCVESHGGKLSVASAPDAGSCFSFTLPLVADSK